MNEYFMMGLVIAIFVISYFYKVEQKKNFTLQVELDLLKVKRNLDEVNVKLSATTLPERPVMPQLFRDSDGNVFIGTDPRRSDSNNGNGPE